ncbi:hypothetical protein LCGC14_0342690 [marine sediment metagenome]|uniref:Uncharacterized protein n=1 Tax=marine sediment metagenome TaxID=412755 RepID=A0A0F9W0R4_9ZZZZ
MKKLILIIIAIFMVSAWCFFLLGNYIVTDEHIEPYKWFFTSFFAIYFCIMGIVKIRGLKQ